MIPEPGSKNAVFEPVVAVDPQNENHIIIAAMVTDSGSDAATCANIGTPYLCANIHYHMTTDGGASWTSSEIPHGPNAGPNHPLAEATATYDPRLGFLPDGTILLEGRGLNSASASTSSGIGFATGTARGERIFSARSTDGGRTFTDFVIISQGDGVLVPGPSPSDAEGSTIAGHQVEEEAFSIAPDGTILTVWTNITATLGEEASALMMWSVSRDGGRTWAAAHTMPGTAKRVAPYDALITQEGTWIVAFLQWSGAATGGNPGDYEAWVARSADQGKTWGTKEIGAATWFPAVTQDGSLLVYAFPARNDDHTFTPSVTISQDDGGSFAPVHPLDAPQLWAATVTMIAGRNASVALYYGTDPEGSAHELRAVAVGTDWVSVPLVVEAHGTQAADALGDYFGLASTSGGAVAVWPDIGGEPAIHWARLHVLIPE